MPVTVLYKSENQLAIKVPKAEKPSPMALKIFPKKVPTPLNQFPSSVIKLEKNSPIPKVILYKPSVKPCQNPPKKSLIAVISSWILLGIELIAPQISPRILEELSSLLPLSVEVFPELVLVSSAPLCSLPPPVVEVLEKPSYY